MTSNSRLSGRGSAMIVTSRAGRSPCRRELSRRLAARHDVVHPAELREKAGAEVVSTGMQRIAPRSSRSPTRTPARHAGESPSLRKDPGRRRSAVAVGRQTERTERPKDPEEVRSDHRQRVERQNYERDRGRTGSRGSGRPSADSSAGKTMGLLQPYIGPRKLAAAKVFVHKPRRVVAVLESVTRVIRDRPGKAIAERAIESLGRVARGVEREQPAALLPPRAARSRASALGRRRRGERPDRPGPWKPRRDDACSASSSRSSCAVPATSPPTRRDEDDLGARGVRRDDPVQPVCARIIAAERRDEADARALAHAGAQDVREPVQGFRERGRIERGDGCGMDCP